MSATPTSNSGPTVGAQSNTSQYAIIPVTVYANASFLGIDSPGPSISTNSPQKVKLPEKFPYRDVRYLKFNLNDFRGDWERQSFGLLYHQASENGHNRSQGAGCFIESDVTGSKIRGVAYQNSSHVGDITQRRCQLRAETNWISREECTILPTSCPFNQGPNTVRSGVAIPPQLADEYYQSIDTIVSSD
jgi:hypothetical protein